MTSQLSSQIQSLPLNHNVSIQQIYKQNKMKDLALNKATNLIQLLNLELEVQRNSYKESLRQLQEDLKQKYEFQIQQLKDKITFLEQQRSNGTVSFSNEKTIRPSVFNRVNSAKSFNNKKKITINKKYTQTSHRNQSIQYQNKQSPIFTNYFRHDLVQLNQWRNSVTVELNQLIKSQYDELTTFINSIQNITDEYDHLINNKSDKNKNLYEEISYLVISQNKLINSFHAYTKELDDLYKSAIFQLNSLLSNKINDNKMEIFQIQSVRKQILKIMQNKKRSWQEEIEQLNCQNIQLKTITQSMIKLIQEQKKIRF